MIYHYTNLQGLLGIINSKSIWASHCEYLNDSSEYNHAIDFAKSFSSNIFMEDDYLGAFGFGLRRALSNMDKNDIYVSSFSEKPDLLSQWRGYCEPNMGVCIGFKREVIEEFCDSKKYILRKCLYSHEKQEELIRSLLMQCLNDFPSAKISREVYDKLETKLQVDHELGYSEYTTDGDGKKQAILAFNNFCNSVQELAPFMKNQGFHEEAEWRIICKNPEKDIKYRQLQSHLTPYMEIPIIEFSSSVISEIIIGPNPDSSQCLNSVERLLLSNGFLDVNVIPSNIPFSSW